MAEPKPPKPEVSYLIAYFLWIFGGVFGLHHLYLGRLNHAFVWYCTLGGVFGLGWFRDVWRIPAYVETANYTKKYHRIKMHHIAKNPKPSGGMVRLFGMLVMGYLMSAVLCGVLPPLYELEGGHALAYYLNRGCSICFIMIGSSLGVYLVANIGDIQCSAEYPIVGTLVAIPWILLNPSNIAMAAVISTLISWWFGLRWKPLHPTSNNRATKCGNYLVMVTLWTCVLGYGLYFNATVGVGNDRVPLSVAMGNFFSSPAWRETISALHHMYLGFTAGGWDKAYHNAAEMFDFKGEAAAYTILELSPEASKDEINRACRRMLAANHPDKFLMDSDKEKAQDRFIRIQQACSTLITIRSSFHSLQRKQEE